MAETETFSPAALLIDEQNPRLGEPNAGQRQALQEIAHLLGRRLQVLAQDIVRNRTDPSSLPIVMEAAERGRYVVLEGNRRLAALRALENPEVIADSVPSGVLRSLRKLSKEYLENPIEELLCVVVKDRDEAHHWIELRHTGGNQGAGLLSWGADEVARFRARGGRAGVGSQALDFLMRRNELTPQERRGRWGTSTFERLLRNPVFREQMGLELVDGILTVRGDEAAAAKALKRVVADLATKKIKVTDVYKRADIEAYAKKQQKVVARRKQGEGVPAAQGGAPIKRTTTRVARTSKQRDKLIPRDCILNIPEGRMRDIDRELRKLSLDLHTNAVSVLLRVFLELSLDTYNDANNLGIDVNARLDTKLRGALKDLLARKKLTDQQAKAARMACQMDSFLAPSVTAMHNYVHNPHASPGPTDLRSTWNKLQAFMTAVWST